MGKIMNAALLASLGLAAGTAGAADTRGFYAGFGAGVALADADQGEIDSGIVDRLEDHEIEASIRNSKLRDSDASLGLIVGYRFLPWLAVDGEWLTLGTVGYDADIDVIDVPVRTTLDADSKGVAFSALGIWPVSERWDLYGRIGMMAADTSVNARATAEDVGQATISESESSEELLFGVGATYNASAQWSVRFDYQRFQDVGDEKVTGEYSVDRLSLQWLYKF